MNFTMSGSRKSRIEQIIAFIHTDLPIPVAPATRRGDGEVANHWLAKDIAAEDKREGVFVGLSSSTRSRITTISLRLFGTSMPMVLRFGRGATIRMPSVPNLSEGSFSNPQPWLTRMPASCNSSSYWVITGPRVAATTLRLILNSVKVDSMASEVEVMSASCSLARRFVPSCSRLISGN